MDYQKALEQAIVYIEQHLDEDIRVEEVSRFAGYSYYHLNRQFIAVLGESVGSYIKKRRLANAAKQLLYTDEKIITIALEHNFESAEAFSRAFKTLYKVSPNEYRKQRMQTFISHKPYLDETHVTHLLKHVNVHPKIVEIDDILVGGFRAEVSLRQKELKELWENFYDLLSMLSVAHKKRRKFGVYEAFDEQMHYYIHEDMEFHEVFGLEVFPDDELPDYFIRKQVKKGRYAVFTHHGSMHTLQRTIDYIWGTWILNTKEVLDAREPFELYDERFLGYDHPDSEIDIYIAIQ